MVYKKENKLLTIGFDNDTPSPREWSNLGYFLTVDRNYRSPDDHHNYLEIIKEMGDIANNQEEHMALIKKKIKEQLGDKVIAIYPVVKYEHSDVVYRLGTSHGFDYSNNGFYIITEKTQKEMGTNKKDFEKVIDQELEIYTKWANGEVYYFILEEKTPDKFCPTCGHNEGGEYEQIDSCGGFYSIEEIFSTIGEKQSDWELIQE